MDSHIPFAITNESTRRDNQYQYPSVSESSPPSPQAQRVYQYTTYQQPSGSSPTLPFPQARRQPSASEILGLSCPRHKHGEMINILVINNHLHLGSGLVCPRHKHREMINITTIGILMDLLLAYGHLSSTALNDDYVLLAPPNPKVSLALLNRLQLSISASALSPTTVHMLVVLCPKYLNGKQFLHLRKKLQLQSYQISDFFSQTPIIEIKIFIFTRMLLCPPSGNLRQKNWFLSLAHHLRPLANRFFTVNTAKSTSVFHIKNHVVVLSSYRVS